MNAGLAFRVKAIDVDHGKFGYLIDHAGIVLPAAFQKT
jgi:hypothetical protein